MSNWSPQSATLVDEAKALQLVELREQYRGESRETQRTRLLEALKRYRVSTIEARKYLDIMHPAGRVKELRDTGHDVGLIWTREETDAMRLHRVGVYFLKGVTP